MDGHGGFALGWRNGLAKVSFPHPHPILNKVGQRPLQASLFHPPVRPNAVFGIIDTLRFFMGVV